MKSTIALAALLAVTTTVASDQTVVGVPMSGRAETVPAQPRPLEKPLKGPTPTVTVGSSEKFLPNPTGATYDPVSPESRAHLDAMIRDIKKR